MDIESLDYDDPVVKEQVKKQLAKIILACRRDPNEFIRHAMRIEGGRRVVQTDVHEEVQDFLSANSRAIIRLPVGTGKTNQITHWRVLWELGNNPNLRIGIVSASKSGVPTKVLDAIKTDIVENRWVHYVFPHLKPRTKPSRNWKATEITVEREFSGKDPSVQLFGLFGHILGTRLDLIILDDIHDLTNTLTETSRDKIYTWVTGEVFSRGSPAGYRVWAVGHRWHKEDTLERLEKMQRWPHLTKSAFVLNQETGEEESFLPELWSTETLKIRERELGALAGPMLRNSLLDFENARFKQEWFERALLRGRGMRLVDRWNPADSPTFTGVDLSTGRSKDSTVIFTMTVLPDGTYRPLDIRIGKYKGPEIIENLVDVYNKYGSIMSVESNGAQDFLLQFAQHLNAIPLKSHVTGNNKRDPHFGVESIAVEFANGMWALPNDEKGPPEVIETWIKDMLNYSPDPKEHTPDTVMAAWICRECARTSGYTHGSGGVGVDDLEDWLDVDTLVR